MVFVLKFLMPLLRLCVKNCVPGRYIGKSAITAFFLFRLRSHEDPMMKEQKNSSKEL
uniref:Uncharacterized protein n=1 Tax=Manihot esculenta TaxID=3983 RepID=A0A2C9V6U1_MANES